MPAVGVGFALNLRPWRTMGVSHWHDCLEISYVLKGQGVFHVGERAFVLEDGALFVIGPGIPHRTVDAPGRRHWNLTLYVHPEAVSWLGQQAERAVCAVGRLSGARRAHEARAVWEALFSDLGRLAAEPEGPDRPMIATKLVEACLLAERCPADTGPEPGVGDGGALPAATRPVRHVRDMLALIESVGAESLSAPAVAASVGLNRHYAGELFRHAVGVSLARYLRERRLRRAYALVAATDAPFAEVARRCGFSDVSALYRAFVRTFGRTPGAVRRLGRGCVG